MSHRYRVLTLTLAVLLAGVVGTSPASAHTDRHRDPNDSKGEFDIASVKTTHRRDRIRFEISAYETIHLPDLDVRRTRYFLIGLDVDQRASDRRLFERCIFIIDRPGAVALATDCGSWRMDESAVTRPSSRTLATTIDLKRLQVDGDFGFAVISYWGEGGCRDTCVDAVPNRRPLYLEDRTAPRVTLLEHDIPTEPSFPLEFTVKDGKGSGIKEWVIEKRASTAAVWETVATGRGDGTKAPTIAPGGGTWSFRVRATDRHGNTGVSGEIRLSVPYDDTEFSSFSSFGGTVTTVADAQAFGGSYTSLATGATVTMTLQADSSSGCAAVRFYGPGGAWQISLSVNGAAAETVSGSGTGARQQWRYATLCPGDVDTYEITVTGAEPFGLDQLTVEGASLVPH